MGCGDRASDETAGTSSSSQSTVEGLHLGAPDGVLPFLRLKVDFLKPELSERNHAVNSTVARAANPLKVSSARAVAHAVEEPALYVNLTDLSKNMDCLLAELETIDFGLDIETDMSRELSAILEDFIADGSID